MTIVNRTNYFSPDTCRSHVSFVSNKSYKFRKMKVEGYENRLYWEFRYCFDHSGQTFYYTLTYNNKSLPQYEGFNCFDYNDLVHFLNGGFKKRLLREYGTNFKYFVGAELGEGKGKRGLSNNPHYHILFFLRSADDSRYPYKVIEPTKFRTLVKRYWQGFDEYVDGKHDYRTAFKGIAKEGDNCGLVDNFRACTYCAKYVTKDVRLIKRERKIKELLYQRFISSFPEDDFDRFDKAQRLVDDELKVYRNRYCNKCRISQGVGDYALQFINDKMNPFIQIPSKNGFKNRPLSMYYYRKLFTDVVKDAVGNNIRVLNPLGMQFKSSRLHEQLDKLSDKTFSLLRDVDEQTVRDALNSSLNNGIVVNQSFIDDLYSNVDLISKRYAEYKLVYEDRYFSYSFDGLSKSFVEPSINVAVDYSTFSYPSYYKVSYSPSRLFDFFKNDCEGYLSYDSHSYFLRYIGFFRFIDLLSDYLFVQTDRENERKANEIREVSKFHKKRAFKQYLSTL